ncbi:MAG: hypothetical protein ACERKV_14055 [Clostridiaceae bacterium]
MIKIAGTLMKNNKIVKEEIVISTIEGSYQEKLKECMTEICYKLDIAKPYWLPKNMNDYNARNKTSFDYNNFIEEINFDKLVIEELDMNI